MDSCSSSSSSACGESSTIGRVLTITDDTWSEIFLHLPLNSIFKFKCVSKVWISHLTDPNFIHKWIQLNHTLNKSSPWTLVYTVRLPTLRLPDIPSFAYAYRDNHMQSQLFSSSHTGFSFRFLKPKPVSPKSNAEVEAKKLMLLSSSCGLVLCCFVRPLRYYVCNPLTEKWVSLPPPPSDSAWAIHGFICNPLISTSYYKVVHIPDFGDNKNKFSIEIFSSDIGEWMVYEVLCHQSVTWRHPLSYSRTVMHKGSLYWIESHGRVLIYDLNNNNGSCGTKCKFLNLPDKALADYDDLFFSRTDYYRSLCLGESEGLICYVRIKRKTKTLSVWVLQEENDWHLVHKDIDLRDFVEEMDIKLHEDLAELEEPQLLDEGQRANSLRVIQVWCFDPFDKNVVVIGYQKYIWAYDICNRRWEELCNPSFQVDELMPFVLQPMPSVLPRKC